MFPRSKQGASFAIVQMIPERRFEVCLSVGLYMEWMAVLTRFENLPPGVTPVMAIRFLRHLASFAHPQDIHYLWRPFLNDPNDDMVLELAFAAGCTYIVTHNMRDFQGADRLGVQTITPGNFLNQLRKAS
jgi:predicted nucleic acid-binding protein